VKLTVDAISENLLTHLVRDPVFIPMLAKKETVS